MVQKIEKRYQLFVLLSLIFYSSLLSGCHYYMVTTVPQKSDYSVHLDLIDSTKYVIVHFKDSIFSLERVKVDTVGKSISGDLKEVARNHRSYKSGNTGKANRYYKKYQYPINEVHLYIDMEFNNRSKKFNVNYSEIYSVHIYNRDAASAVKPPLIAGLVVTGIAIIVVMLYFSLDGINVY